MESKEGVNMCKALENLENQGKQKGIEEGKLEAANGFRICSRKTELKERASRKFYEKYEKIIRVLAC